MLKDCSLVTQARVSGSEAVHFNIPGTLTPAYVLCRYIRTLFTCSLMKTGKRAARMIATAKNATAVSARHGNSSPTQVVVRRERPIFLPD